MESVAFEKTGYGRNASTFPTRVAIFSDSFLLPSIGFTQFMDTVHSDSLEKIRGALRSAINSKIGFDIEIRINKPNGDFAWVNWKCFLIEENHTGAILLEGIALDITSHKTTEKALAIASSLFENNRDGIFIADQTGRITVVNYQFTRMTGLSQEQIMSNKQWFLQPGISDSSCYSQLLRRDHLYRP